MPPRRDGLVRVAAADGDVGWPACGLDGGGFMSDLVLVPYAGAMLVPIQKHRPIAIASLSDNIPDGWRAVGPYSAELAGLDPADRRVLVVGRLDRSVRGGVRGCTRLSFDYVDTTDRRRGGETRRGRARRRQAQ